MEEKVKLFFDKEKGRYTTFYKGTEIPGVFEYEISQKSHEQLPFADARLSIEVEIVNEKPEETFTVSEYIGSYIRIEGNEIT